MSSAALRLHSDTIANMEPLRISVSITDCGKGLSDGEHVEQIVFCQTAEEPQGRMDLCGLAALGPVFWYTGAG
jgi:hypothetical protein